VKLPGGLERPGFSRQRFARALGAPALIAIGLSTVGASLYFGLGVVAGNALGLTPVAYLLAAAFFVITVMSYVEGNSLHPERGGASTFARYALDELWSFVAGWAIILDYLIVTALAVFAASQYLGAFSTQAASWPGEALVALAVVAFVAWSNIRGMSAGRLSRLLRVGVLNVVLSFAIVAYGLLTLHPLAGFESVELGTPPQIAGVLFAAVVAAAALTGIESASGLAGELVVGRRGLRQVVVVVAVAVPLILIGISVVALMALPVVNGSTQLGTVFVDAPVLGVVSAFQPEWVRGVFSAAVGVIAVAVLVLAANGNMLGLSRLGYSLATNRQIPSALGRLHPQRSTPYVLVSISSILVLVLAVSSDVDFLAGLFAFGATVAFTLAHVSVIIMRFREPTAPRAFRVPLSIPAGRGSIPLPALLGAITGAAAWVSVVALHEGARVVGGGWMAFGIVLYVIYRKGQGKPLRKRFVIPEQSLRDAPEVEYGNILVPVFGTELDDDIVGTAGRLAAEEGEDGQEVAIEALYVIEIPMSLPIDAVAPEGQVQAARRALNRAKEVGEEYEGVIVHEAMVRGRTAGQTIVAEAKRRGAEVIVLAAEAPTRIRGGVLFGGHAGPKDRVVGEVTRYVVQKAPCRVLLTAPPGGEDTIREAVAPT
jgi:basic amino acid/polyamine antiporter, APA family